MKIAQLTLALIAVASFTSCNVKSEQAKESYNLTENGCSTGDHSFEASSADDVKAQLCSTLKNNAANNFCAVASRKNLFDSKCSGGFVTTARVLPESELIPAEADQK